MKMFSLSICCLLVGKHHRASLRSRLFHAHCKLYKFVSPHSYRLNIIASECTQENAIVLRRRLLNEFDGVNEIEPHSRNNDVIDFKFRIIFLMHRKLP